MSKIKLSRPIRNAADTENIEEITIKDEKDVSASDFYNLEISTDGKMNLGTMAGVVADLTGLTDEQVASLKPKDYMAIMGEVTSFLE